MCVACMGYTDDRTRSINRGDIASAFIGDYEANYIDDNDQIFCLTDEEGVLRMASTSPLWHPCATDMIVVECTNEKIKERIYKECGAYRYKDGFITYEDELDLRCQKVNKEVAFENSRYADLRTSFKYDGEDIVVTDDWIKSTEDDYKILGDKDAEKLYKAYLKHKKNLDKKYKMKCNLINNCNSLEQLELLEW